MVLLATANGLAFFGSRATTPGIDCPKLKAPEVNSKQEYADLCLGWFWGPDYYFSNLEGVHEVTVGYAGGDEEFPTYREIKDHTEAVRVVYDPSILSYAAILQMFFEQHSPGMKPWKRQYRSAILANTAEQKKTAQEMVIELGRSKKVYTDVEDVTDFYQAEEYHLKYIEKSTGKRGY